MQPPWVAWLPYMNVPSFTTSFPAPRKQPPKSIAVFWVQLTALNMIAPAGSHPSTCTIRFKQCRCARIIYSYLQLSSIMLPISHEEWGYDAIFAHGLVTDAEHEKRVPFRSMMASSPKLLCFVVWTRLFLNQLGTRMTQLTPGVLGGPGSSSDSRLLLIIINPVLSYGPDSGFSKFFPRYLHLVRYSWVLYDANNRRIIIVL